MAFETLCPFLALSSVTIGEGRDGGKLEDPDQDAAASHAEKKKLQPTEGLRTRMAGSNGTLSQNEGHAGSQEDLLLYFVPALFLIQKGMFACP